MSANDAERMMDVFSIPITAELLEELEGKRGPDLEFMLRDAHRPFYAPGKVYRIELTDPSLRISYSIGPLKIDRNKLH